jgi:hypothetical protein
MEGMVFNQVFLGLLHTILVEEVVVFGLEISLIISADWVAEVKVEGEIMDESVQKVELIIWEVEEEVVRIMAVKTNLVEMAERELSSFHIYRQFDYRFQEIVIITYISSQIEL